MTEETARFKIIFEKMNESIKNQEEAQIDFNEIIKMSDEIKSLEKIVSDTSIDDEPMITTRA